MSRYRTATGIMLALVAVYFIVTVVLPPNPVTMARFNLSSGGIRFINLTFVILYGLVWLIALSGYIKLRQYAELISKNKDGKAFMAIAIGLGFLAFRLPLASVVNSTLLYLARDYSWLTPASVISVNYIGVLFSLLAFGFISYGTDQLMELLPHKPSTKARYIFIILSLLLVAAYTQFAIGRPGYDQPVAAGEKATYYLPSWLIVSTIIVPYAYLWYWGFMSVFSLRKYQQQVKGLVYRQGLRWLYWGIAVVIVASIILQFGAAQTIRVSRFQLQPVLVSTYVFLGVLAAGFGLIMAGAKKLKKIEEV